MYASSSKWSADWISEGDVEEISTQLSGKIQSPRDPNSVGINYGLHFTGGEPFLNFDLLLLRRHLALQSDEFKELSPREFYAHLK